jgi:UDP-2-acetamido-3-amino-2,3-dideoxy-glucuronate N-acetyltransferase
MIHDSAFVDEPCEIGAGTRIWHFSHVMSGARIGERCNLGQNVLVATGVTLGNFFNDTATTEIYTGVTLEDDVFCGPSMVFTNVINPRSEIPRREEFKATTVRFGASLGANCTVICGVEIGRFAFVAAGAVITRDVEPYALMTGVPARRSGWVCRCGVRLPAVDGGGTVTCGECGNEYEDRASQLEAIREVQGGG